MLPQKSPKIFKIIGARPHIVRAGTGFLENSRVEQVTKCTAGRSFVLWNITISLSLQEHNKKYITQTGIGISLNRMMNALRGHLKPLIVYRLAVVEAMSRNSRAKEQRHNMWWLPVIWSPLPTGVFRSLCRYSHWQQYRGRRAIGSLQANERLRDPKSVQRLIQERNGRIFSPERSTLHSLFFKYNSKATSFKYNLSWQTPVDKGQLSLSMILN